MFAYWLSKKNSKEIKKDGANRILDQYEQLQNV